MIDSTIDAIPAVVGGLFLAPHFLLFFTSRGDGRGTTSRSARQVHGSRVETAARSGHAAPVRAATRPPDVRAALTAEEHWQRIVGILRGTVDRSRRAAELHAAAAIQVGAAEHAFDRLCEEIAGVVALPMPALVRPSQVVRFEARPRHPQLAA